VKEILFLLIEESMVLKVKRNIFVRIILELFVPRYLGGLKVIIIVSELRVYNHIQVETKHQITINRELVEGNFCKR
jgi:hypothetical protein